MTTAFARTTKIPEIPVFCTTVIYNLTRTTIYTSTENYFTQTIYIHRNRSLNRNIIDSHNSNLAIYGKICRPEGEANYRYII